MFEESVLKFHSLPIKDRVGILYSMSTLAVELQGMQKGDQEITQAITREISRNGSNGDLFMDIYSCHLLGLDWKTPPVLTEGYLIKWKSGCTLDINRNPPVVCESEGNGLKLYPEEDAKVCVKKLAEMHPDREYFYTWDTLEGIQKDIAKGRIQDVDTIECDLSS